MRLVGRLGPRFARRGRKRGTIVLAAPAGETHSLPLALFADLLRARGFDVLDLGGDVPIDSLASTVAGTDNLLAVCLGCTTTSGNDASVTEAIDAVRERPTWRCWPVGRRSPVRTRARALGADDGGLPTLEAIARSSTFPARPPRPDRADPRA